MSHLKGDLNLLSVFICKGGSGKTKIHVMLTFKGILAGYIYITSNTVCLKYNNLSQLTVQLHPLI